MSKLKSRVAYLHGLARGLEIKEHSKEGQLLTGILELLDKMADEVEGIRDAQDELEDYVEAMDEDLADIEDEVLGEEGFTEVDCPACGESLLVEDDLFEDEDTLELTCPKCGETIHDLDFSIEEDSDTLEGMSRGHPVSELDRHPKE